MDVALIEPSGNRVPFTVAESPICILARSCFEILVCAVTRITVLSITQLPIMFGVLGRKVMRPENLILRAVGVIVVVGGTRVFTGVLVGEMRVGVIVGGNVVFVGIAVIVGVIVGGNVVFVGIAVIVGVIVGGNVVFVGVAVAVGVIVGGTFVGVAVAAGAGWLFGSPGNVRALISTMLVNPSPSESRFSIAVKLRLWDAKSLP